MSEYVFLFRIAEAAQREAMGTPERAQKSMEAWRHWIAGLEANGHLRNGGQPLDRTGRVVRGREKMITDGPFIEAKDLVAGFIIVEARDLDEATELAAGCPMLAGDGSVEIRPILTSPA